jgi:hypothetical protein
MNVQKNIPQNINSNYLHQVSNPTNMINPVQQQKTQNKEYTEFLFFLNQKNNMNLIKIILFYSKYSKLCDDFLNALHPYYKQIINFICVDDPNTRKRLMNSKYKLQVVPSIFMLFENGVVNVHTGKELIQLVDFFNKNMETFMVVKTHQTQNIQLVSNQDNILNKNIQLQNANNTTNKITPLNFNIRKEKNERFISNKTDSFENELDSSLSDSIQSRQSLLMKENQELSRINSKNSKNKEVTHLPRVKDPIPYEFNKKVEIGMSSKRLVPRGKKEHEKMALTSVKFIEGNKLDTVEEEDDEEDEDDNNEIDINIEDAEILNDDIDELINSEDDPTIDPILKKDNKKSIKEIAADMQQVRGDPDSKKIPI